MALRYHFSPKGAPKISLVECPACGEDLSGRKLASAHIRKHDPEDFGLTPIGERREQSEKTHSHAVPDGGKPREEGQ